MWELATVEKETLTSKKKMLNYIIRSTFTTFFQIVDPG